ncbi:hypothetical protein ASC78_17295 [Variovorax sp. Root318D1]|uniref:ATP-binding domain-containing protein n=1 Tax=Variovorax sp. Root318D1 TaxID=1736513 RepID=UPI0006FE5DA1|nr:ATP-binding domain-containing protein [Variovorax sp. Root318D1]KQU82348.1 hypothetical protein ASC78_17295 [Variovorax sp. Root318D1]
MDLTEDDKRVYSAGEISVLRGVIDYAERMIFEDKNLDVLGGFADAYGYVAHSHVPLYKLLRKSAYAKTVVIDTERKGRLEFRLSPTEAVYPSEASGYCTPHSPVGRLAAFVQPGYEGRSKLWGDYRIIEVRSFDRYGGPEFEPNVRNFLRMGVDGEHGKGFVADLRNFLDKKRGPKAPAPAASFVEPVEPMAEAAPQASIELPPAEIQIAQLTVVDEPDELGIEPEIDADEDWSADEPPVKADEYYGLSERFFTHQTIEQNQIIARSPIGAMFVEGIAGSGKTSAALGRTKMLTTFNAVNVSDEQSFRDIVGQDQDHWSADFAGQFSQEGSIGFVRTGELIQYLQETCRRIDLPDLPVKEYKELQTRLREHRRSTSSSVPGRRWSGLVQAREAQEATTMKWLHAADRAVAQQIASRLIDTLPTSTYIAEQFEADERSKVRRVADVALEQLRHEMDEVANELTQSPREGAFVLDRLAVRLQNKLEEVRKRVMSPRVIWTRVEGRSLFGNDENALARTLVEMKAPLYLRSGQRLVFVDKDGPLDKNLELLTTTGEPLSWSDDTSELMAANKVIVREPSGKNVYAVPSDVNHLFVRLLPEATELLYVPINGELRRLPREPGLGRVKLPMLPVEDAKRDEDAIGDEAEADAEQVVPGQPRKGTADAVFTRLVRRRMLQQLTSIADLYFAALQTSTEQFPNAGLASRLQAQLGTFKLADEDVDLLLCLSHLIGRNLKQGGLRQLQEPAFYQAVFVDEVQDFTEQQVYLMVEQANPKYRAITVVGDIAQKLHHGSSIDLRACFPAQALPHVRLTENLRQADMPGLALFSASFRSVLQGDDLPSPVLTEKARKQGADLVRPRFSVCETDADMDARIVDALTKARRHQTVAVLFPDAESAAKVYKRLEQSLRENMIDAELSEKVNLARRHIRHFANVANAKGLEFDVVLLAGLDHYDLANSSNVNRLYVGITRARQSLVLLSGSKTLAPGLVKVRDLYQQLVGQP